MLEEKKTQVRLNSIKDQTWSNKICVLCLYVFNLACNVHCTVVDIEVGIERRIYFELHFEPQI